MNSTPGHGWRVSFILVAGALLLFASGASAANLSAAKYRIVAAQEMLDSRRLDDAEDKLKEAEKFIADATPDEKAPFVAQIKALRDKIAAAPNPEQDRLLRAAQGLLTQAKSAQASGSAKDAADKLTEAEKVLAPVPDAKKADVLAQIKALRDAPAPSKAEQAAPAAAAAAKPAEASAANLTAAKYRIQAAQSALESGRTDDVESKLEEAEKFIAPATAEEKAPFLAQIQAIRDKMGGSDKDKENDRIVRQARLMLEESKSMNANGAEETLQRTEKTLEPVPDAKKADVLAQIKALREARASSKMSDAAKAVASQINSRLNLVEQDIGQHSPQRASDDLARANEMMAADNAKALDANARKSLQTRIDQLQANLAGGQKSVAIRDADQALASLDQKLASDPFHGLDESKRYNLQQEFEALTHKAHYALDNQAKTDPDIKTRSDRLAALETKIDADNALWVKDRDIAELSARWKSYTQNDGGWEQEAPEAPSGGGLLPWRMGKTVAALRSSVYWLGLKDTTDILAKYKDDPSAQAVRGEAEKTRDAAGAKLNDAFNKSLDDAEKRPLPRGYDLTIPEGMARDANELFAGTTYKDADVARATKLDAKWKEQLAAIQREAAAALKEMTEDANSAWPKIAGAIKTEDGFKPADAAAFKGKTVRIKAVRNRSGWDFDGRYDIALWIGNVPLAGRYEPRVAKAMRDTVLRLHQDIDDHIDWEVVAVIEGPGKINRRIFTEVIDAKTRDRIAKIESYEPMDCILIHVIAMHAGPVAIGPE